MRLEELEHLLWAALVASLQWVLGLLSVSPGEIDLNLSLGSLGGVNGLDLILPGSTWWGELLLVLLWSDATGLGLLLGLGLLGGSWSDVRFAATLGGSLLAPASQDLLTTTERIEVLLDQLLSSAM